MEDIEWDGTCLYCGKHLPSPRSFKYYCTKSHKARAQVKRSKARAEEMAERGACPREGALTFGSERTALRAAARFSREHNNLNVKAYKCSCGRWHMGNNESAWKLLNSRRTGEVTQ